MNVKGYRLSQKVIPIDKTLGAERGLEEWLAGASHYDLFLRTFGFLYITSFNNDRVTLSISPEPGAKGYFFHVNDVRPYLEQQGKIEVE